MNLTHISRKTWQAEFRGPAKGVYRIKLRTPDDQEKFEDFLSKIEHGSGYPVGVELAESDLRPGEFRISRNHLLAWYEGKIVAGVSFHPGTRHDYHFRHGCRFHLNTLKEFQGRGIATNLLQSLEDWVKEHAIERLSTGTVASNIGAIKLLTKCGYQLEGRTLRAIKIRLLDTNTQEKKDYWLDALLFGKWIGKGGEDYPNQHPKFETTIP